jgi:hypothetical protein
VFDLYDLGQSFKGWSENIRRIGGAHQQPTIDQLYCRINGPPIPLVLAPILGQFARWKHSSNSTGLIIQNSERSDNSYTIVTYLYSRADRRSTQITIAERYWYVRRWEACYLLNSLPWSSWKISQKKSNLNIFPETSRLLKNYMHHVNVAFFPHSPKRTYEFPRLDTSQMMMGNISANLANKLRQW